MNHPFKITAIDLHTIAHFLEMTDEELAAANACRMTANVQPGFPCRLSLQDAEVGEALILLNYIHHDVASPYRSTGPVFIRINAEAAQLEANELPGHLGHRLLSLRAYDENSMLVAAKSFQGGGLGEEIQVMLENEQVKYLHIHNAAQGCFHCRVERLGAE